MAINKSGDWNVLVLTNAGRDMLTQARAGHKLSFTKIVIGDGTATGTAIDPLVKIKSPRLELPIAKNETVHQGQMRLQFRVSNAKVTTGFYFREIGLMAKLDEGEEVLYSYTTCGSKAKMIYDKTYPIQEKVVNIDTVTDNAANIRVILDMSIVYATKKDIEESVNKHRKATEIDHPDASVTTRKLRDKAVTAAKLADDINEKLDNAYVKKTGDTMSGNLDINANNSDYSALRLHNNSGRHLLLESTADTSANFGILTYRNDNSSDNLHVLSLPKKKGTLAITSEVVSKSGDTMTGKLLVNNEIQVNGNWSFLQNNNADCTMIRNNWWGFWTSKTAMSIDWQAGKKTPLVVINAEGLKHDGKKMLRIDDITGGKVGNNGWTKLPNGYVSQWGYYNFPSGQSEAIITLPISVSRIGTVLINDVGTGFKPLTGSTIAGNTRQIKLYNRDTNGTTGCWWHCDCWI
ncbi:phage tail protein [Veillonella intestinalis]|uniref:phage tail-collar fiber domain-containing protein n=1 Tax=Veillonella intestinalis TaxID=2941341 RepID=UPI00203DD1F8|nr:phage tail protein [Veillonella intestinalis]